MNVDRVAGDGEDAFQFFGLSVLHSHAIHILYIIRASQGHFIYRLCASILQFSCCIFNESKEFYNSSAGGQYTDCSTLKQEIFSSKFSRYEVGILSFQFSPK